MACIAQRCGLGNEPLRALVQQVVTQHGVLRRTIA
jgi:hypothetical protein